MWNQRSRAYSMLIPSSLVSSSSILMMPVPSSEPFVATMSKTTNPA